LGKIDVEGLCYSYPNVAEQALTDINLKIEPGEFILLTGPSGCGKTTFCRCLNGLIPHFYNGEMRGEVKIDGISTREHPTYELAKHVGLIFQNPDNQIFSLTVEKDIAFGLENLGESREKMIDEINWAMNRVDIAPLKERGTHELSGGQKQRLTIASILAMHPGIIVMDEPTAFLDPVGAEKIFDVLQALNREHGITILLIEHRMDLAVKHCSRIIVFDKGRIVKDGTPREIFSSDETRLIGIGIPRMVELGKRLGQRGCNIGIPLDSDEAYSILTPFLKMSAKANIKQALPELEEIVGEYMFSLPNLTSIFEDASYIGTVSSGPTITVSTTVQNTVSILALCLNTIKNISFKLYRGSISILLVCSTMPFPFLLYGFPCVTTLLLYVIEIVIVIVIIVNLVQFIIETQMNISRNEIINVCHEIIGSRQLGFWNINHIKWLERKILLCGCAIEYLF
jgi:energy-coupling factor transporter ATP-binding protein EcfA2